MNTEMEKELERLNKLQKEIEDKLDNEIKEEEELEQAIETITQNCLLYGKSTTNINGRNFRLAVKINNLYVYLVAIDINKFNILKRQYVPYQVSTKINNMYDAKANIRVVVEGFVRHITGKIKPEMLEEDE